MKQIMRLALPISSLPVDAEGGGGGGGVGVGVNDRTGVSEGAAAAGQSWRVGVEQWRHNKGMAGTIQAVPSGGINTPSLGHLSRARD